MNSKIKLMMAVVLAGMFLIPPVSALSGDSGSGMATQRPEPAPDAEPSEANPPAAPSPIGTQALVGPTNNDGGRNAKATMIPMPVPAANERDIMVNGQPYFPVTSRARQGGPDVYLAFRGFDVVAPHSVVQWDFVGVLAKVGDQTQFNITVNNSGDTDTTQASVTFKIRDAFDVEVFNQTQSSLSIPALSNITLYFYWTPTYATDFYINLTINCPNNVYTGNPMMDISAWFYGWSASGVPLFGVFGVALWSDTGESTTGWTGDIGAPFKWHINGDPANQNETSRLSHTDPNCWYEGSDLIDRYENNMNVSMKSSKINLGYCGQSYWLRFNYKFHGKLPTADGGDKVDQYWSTDNGANWNIYNSLDGPALFRGGAIDPFAWYFWVADYNGNNVVEPWEYFQDIHGYAGEQLNFRNQFTSNQAITETGLYFDDFVIWGQEVFDNVQCEITSNLADVTQNDSKDITARITNVGKNAQPKSFNCTLNITKRGDIFNILYSGKKVVNALAPGASQEITFNWVADAPGDYVVVVNVTDMKDYDEFNDYDFRWAHVARPNPKILVVDDNPYRHSTRYPHNSTTTFLLNAITAVPGFDNYGEYIVSGGGDGPSQQVMSKYEVVIWTTGWDDKNVTKNGTLTPNDVNSTIKYLDGGGTLWLVGMGVLNDLGADNKLVKDYLHVASNSKTDVDIKGPEDQDNPPNRAIIPATPPPGDDSEAIMYGVPGNPVGNGFACPMAMPGGLNYTWDWADILYSDGLSEGVFFQNNSNQDPVNGPFLALSHASKNYRLVFQSYEFSFMSYYGNRSDYAKAVLGFLMGGMTMRVDSPNVSAPERQVIDPGGSAVYTLTISNGGTKTRTLNDMVISEAPPGWTATADPYIKNGVDAQDILAGELLEVTLTVTAPATAVADSFANIDFTVSFKDYGPTLTNSTRTMVRAVPGILISAAVTSQNLTGAGSVSYYFNVRNTGNLPITVDLLKTGDYPEWLKGFLPQVSLSPFEDKNLSAVKEVPPGYYRFAGNYSLRDTITARFTYLGTTYSSAINLTTNIRVAQIFQAVILKDEVELNPADGEVDMNLAKPSVKVTIKITAPQANGNDTVTLELRPKNKTPSGSSSPQSWDGKDWTLPKGSVETTPFMSTALSTSLTILVPTKADAGEYTVEIRATPGSGRTSDGDSTTITIRVAKPDLQIVPDSLIFTPKEPQVGTQVKMKVTVKNIGGLVARNIDVVFYGTGDNEIGRATIPELLPNGGTYSLPTGREETSWNGSWTGFIAGENQITVRVDPDNKIPRIPDEQDEFTDVLIGLQSDIVIEADSAVVFLLNGAQKTSVTEGETVIIEVTVKNEGPYGLNLTNVVVTLTDQTTNEPPLTSIISELKTRSSGKATFTWTASKPGTHTFSVRAAPPEELVDKNPDNNEQTATLKVDAKPSDKSPLGALGSPMMMLLIGIIVAVVIVALVLVMMRRRPPARTVPAPAPPEDATTVVVAEEVGPETEAAGKR